MGRDILKYGVIAGLVCVVAMWATLLAFRGAMPHGAMGMAIGYVGMLVALSAVWFGIRHHRDAHLGGSIRFWPAFGLGLGISFVAALFYVASWEVANATVASNFTADYAAAALAEAKAEGADAAALAKMQADMDGFADYYANPLFRLPMVFAEIFPVGVLVSLVSALLLRRSRKG